MLYVTTADCLKLESFTAFAQVSFLHEGAQNWDRPRIEAARQAPRALQNTAQQDQSENLTSDESVAVHVAPENQNSNGLQVNRHELGAARINTEITTEENAEHDQGEMFECDVCVNDLPIKDLYKFSQYFLRERRLECNKHSEKICQACMHQFFTAPPYKCPVCRGNLRALNDKLADEFSFFGQVFRWYDGISPIGMTISFLVFSHDWFGFVGCRSACRCAFTSSRGGGNSSFSTYF